ncbi:hypothetical protein OBB02_02470 [Candidatus Puniceispirillum sp.]|nr:hypothetical protein [Candidatus Puniceispirillum sp.]
MKARQTVKRMEDATLRRLSRFDAADLGPHATALFNELARTAASGLPLATVILAASIVDVVLHERAGPVGYLDGAAFSHAGSAANLAWLRGRRNHLVHHVGPSDGLMGECDAGLWLASDAERAVTALLDFLDDLQLSN